MPDARSKPALYAGFGCRKGCPVEQLDALLRQTMAAHGLMMSALCGIASIDLKADEPGLLALSAELKVPLTLFGTRALLEVEPLLSHRSATAFAHTGCWGVAESAALALAARHHRHSGLKVPRQMSATATLALAWGG